MVDSFYSEKELSYLGLKYIGDNVIIQSGSVIGADACYFQRRKNNFVKFESCGRVIIEDDVEIGALCAIDIGVTSDTVVGKGTKTDNHVQVGHDAKIGKYCFLGAHSAVGGVSVLKDNVSIWSSLILPLIRIPNLVSLISDFLLKR